MDSLSDLSRLHVIIATCFVAINCLIIVPWRKSLKTMISVTVATIFLLIAVSGYAYFFTSTSLTLVLFVIDILWFILAFILAKYRDTRTVYYMLSVWMFCIAGTAIATTIAHYLPMAWQKLTVIFIIHSIFPVTLAIFVREPYHSMMTHGKKGWLFGCIVVGLPLIALRMMTITPIPLSQNPTQMPLAVITSIASILLYITFARITDYILKQKRKKNDFDIMAAHAMHIEERLQDAAQREKQNAILRHDLRHFAGVTSACIQSGHYNEALASTQSLLQHPAMLSTEFRYCKNPIINSLMNSFAQKAAEHHIGFDASIGLQENMFIDTMDLAVLLSNLLENALNATVGELPTRTNQSGVRVKLHMAGQQLFISISNTCDCTVNISAETGLPVSDEVRQGHGIGLLSVNTFLEKYNSQVDCVQSDGWFQLRIIATPPTPLKEPSIRNRHSKNTLFKVNTIISTLVIGGFLIAAMSSLYSFNRLFRTDIESVSMLVSNAIHGNVDSMMALPINVSVSMAQDTLLMELMRREATAINGAAETIICEYLSSYQKKYGFDSVTITSVKTGAYYHFSNGIARYMSSTNIEDKWFYDFLNEPAEFKLNIDADKIMDYGTTIFADTKLIDKNGNVIGIIGIGMKAPHLQKLLSDNVKGHNAKAFLIDKLGEVQISSEGTEYDDMNLFDVPLFSILRDGIANDKNTIDKQWYSDGNVDGYVITKYIPSLNWYLVVEKDTAEFRNIMLIQLVTGLAFMAAVVVTLMVLIASILTRFYKALAGKAEKDTLTGLRNRESFEQELQVYGSRLADYAQFALGVFALSNLSAMNESLGHQAGDASLKRLATLLLEVLAHCPVFRTSGNEFIAVFVNMSEDEIKNKFNQLELAVGQDNKIAVIQAKIAIGYAFSDETDLSTLSDAEGILREALKQMHNSKKEE